MAVYLGMTGRNPLTWWSKVSYLVILKAQLPHSYTYYVDLTTLNVRLTRKDSENKIKADKLAEIS